MNKNKKSYVKFGQTRKFKDLVDKHLGHLNIKEIGKIFISEMNRIITKDETTMNWLSSNLHGVHKITYSPIEMNSLFYLLDVSKESLREDIILTDGFNKKWEVSSDAFNVLVWMCYYKIITELDNRDKHREDYMKATYFVSYFKMIVGRNNHYFSKYNQDEAVSRLAYDNLSSKHDIKRLGSNYAVIMNKFAHYDYKSKNYNRLLSGTGAMTVYVINYLFSSINDYIKNAMSEVSKAKEMYNDSRGESSSSNIEGESISIINNDVVYRDSLHSVLTGNTPNRNDSLIKFMKEYVGDFNHDSMYKLLEEIKDEISMGDTETSELHNNIINANHPYLYKENIHPPYNNNLPIVVKMLKQYWGASKTTNVYLQASKKNVVRIINKKLKITRMATVSRLTIVTMLYVYILSLLKTNQQ